MKRVRRDARAPHSPAQAAQLSPDTASQPSPRPVEHQTDAAHLQQPASALPANTAIAGKPSASAEPAHHALQAAPASAMATTAADTTNGTAGRPAGAQNPQPAKDAGGRPARDAAARTEGGNSQPDRRTIRSQPLAQEAHDRPASGAQTATPAPPAAATAARTEATAHERSAGEAGDASRSPAKQSAAQRQVKPKRSPLALRVSRGSAGPAAAAKMHRAAVQEVGWKRKAAALSDGSAKMGTALPAGNKRAKQQKAATAAAAKAFVRAPRFDSVASKAGTTRAKIKLAPWQAFETPLRFRSHASAGDASGGAQQNPDMIGSAADPSKVHNSADEAVAKTSQLPLRPTGSAQKAAAEEVAVRSAKVRLGNAAEPSDTPSGDAPAADLKLQADASAGPAKQTSGEAPAVATPAARPAKRSRVPPATADGAAVRSAQLMGDGGRQPTQPPYDETHATEYLPAEIVPMRRAGLRRQTTDGQVRSRCRRADVDMCCAQSITGKKCRKPTHVVSISILINSMSVLHMVTPATSCVFIKCVPVKPRWHVLCRRTRRLVPRTYSSARMQCLRSSGSDGSSART